ncbi:MAG: helix-turn-helix transcriptional regulator [Ruminococcaceae bacterium]|nr:helix-turn-helix transcriptional regulator [Oscillospiraceae bacterium]
MRWRWPWKKTSARGDPQSGSDTAPQPNDDAAQAITQTGEPAQDEQKEQRAALATLTPREGEVFDGLMRGQKLQEIADELGVKYSTVNTHYKNVYKKLGVASRAECLIRYADVRLDTAPGNEPD